MDPKVIALILICIATVSIAGCTTSSSGPAGTTTIPVSLSPGTPVVTESPWQVTKTPDIQTLFSQTPQTTTARPGEIRECTTREDCVPAGCCHPSSCVKKGSQPSCSGIYCTMECSGPLDCGAGSCGCVGGRCSVVPGSPAYSVPAITITASPQRYSPIMSSTPGIGLEVAATGFNPQNASFAWKASYGHFLSWNSPDFRVNELGGTATNHGEKLYWSFTDKPASTTKPVIIAVTATDESGHFLDTSTVTLAWDGDYAVTVKGVE